MQLRKQGIKGEKACLKNKVFSNDVRPASINLSRHNFFSTAKINN